MGRKRNQGKARKAAKAKAQQEAEERGNNQTIQERLSPLAAQVQRCKHGISVPETDISFRFIIAFCKSFLAARGDNLSIMDCLEAAENDTTNEYFADVWSNSTKMEVALSCLLCEGTQEILDGKYGAARETAIFAMYLEQQSAVFLHHTQALIRWNKIEEMHYADQHTLVKFYQRRIPCSCLDEKYVEVKNITKIGLCYNPQCSIPNGQVEYSKTMYCDRCRCVTFCSRECQKAHWKKHRQDCEGCAAMIAEFEANKTQS